MSRYSRCLLILLAVFSASEAAALSIVPLSSQQMVSDSQAIVEGVVTDVQEQVGAGGRPEHVALVRVEVSHKGTFAAGAVIQTWYPGGRLGGLELVVPGTPSFTKGEKVFLFLGNVNGGRAVVLGYIQGYFTIMQNAAGAAVATRKVPIATPGIQKMMQVGQGAPLPDQMNLGDLRSYVGEVQRAPEKANPPAPAAGVIIPLGAGPAGGTGFGGWHAPVLITPSFIAFSLLLFGMSAAALILKRPLMRKPVFALIALVVFAATAQAYVREQIGGHNVSWWASDMPVPWYMNSDSTTDTLNELAGIQSSFDTWENVPTATITFVYAGALPFNPDSPPLYDGERLDYYCCIWWDKQNRSGLLDSGTLGICFYWAMPSDGHLVDADIVFNDKDYNWNAQGQGGDMPLEGVATHEIGHLLGLGHSPDQSATMYYIWHPGSEVLAQDDIDGVTAIYPDTTPPAAPVITTNGGADFITVDALLTLAGTMPSDTWTLEVTCTPSVSGTVAPFNHGDTTWSYSTTLTIPSQVYTFSVVAKDASGNASAPDTISVTFNPTKPIVDEFYLFDLTTFSQTISDWPLVGVHIHAFDTQSSVSYYLLTENASLVPTPADMVASGSSSAPVKFELGQTQGLHTVYAWVVDTDSLIGGPFETTIQLDTVAPFVTRVSSLTTTSVIVEYSEDVQGAGSPLIYTISPSASVSSITPIDQRKLFLKTSALTASGSYTLSVNSSAVTDMTGENHLFPNSGTYAFTAAAQAQITVDSICEMNYTQTFVHYTGDVNGATVFVNYRVGTDTFTDSEVFTPGNATWVGGTTYVLGHFDLYEAIVAWGGSFPFDTYVAIRNITDKSGLSIENNYPPASPAYFLGTLTVNSPLQTDTTDPTIDLFVLRSLLTHSAVSTESTIVSCNISASDTGSGVIRWYLTEDPVPPTVPYALANGSWEQPSMFTLTSTLGSHTVYLYVIDGKGNMASASTSINLIGDAAPIVSISASPTFAEVPPPAQISFSSTASDPESALTGISWDFDDGTFSSETDPLHTYSAPGIYDATFYAKDAWGHVSSAVETITIVSDTTAPTISVADFILHGRTDSPAVTQVNIDGTDFPVTGGHFDPVLALPSGGKTYTITVDDGVNPVHTSTLGVAAP